MKLNIKMIAIAAAMVASGAAHADFIPASTGSSTFGVVAWNTVTNSFYVRDLGFVLNTFLPTNGAPLTGTGEGTSPGQTLPVFDKTPAAGLTIDKTTKTQFGADALWSTWYSAQNAADLKWLVVAADSVGTATGVNTARQVVSVAQGSTFTPVSVGTITNGTANVSGFQFTNGTLSTTGTLTAQQAGGVNGSFVNQTGKTANIGSAADLYYFSRNNAGTGAAATGLTLLYANATAAASIILAANGDVTYTLAGAPVSAIPVPAAAWLLGSGLLGIGGMIRRRKAAAQA
jgi:hypothetical protein